VGYNDMVREIELMKLNNLLRVGLGSWLIIIATIGCSSTKIPLRSDEEMVADFRRHKPESIALMKQCASSSQPIIERGSTILAVELFLHCKSKIEGKDSHEMANYMGSLNLQYVAQKFTKPERPSKQFKGTSYLFVVQQNIYYEHDTTVEEKGYIFSAIPIEKNVITKGSLTEFELGLNTWGRKDLSEIWKLKQIEPNWYLYYRHFFRAH
jgi:hypothetical protein